MISLKNTSVLLSSLMLLCSTSYAQNPLTDAQRLSVVLTDPSDYEEYRKFAYFTVKLLEVEKRYFGENPRPFYRYVQKTPNQNVKVELTYEQALEEQARSTNSQLEGGKSLSDSVPYQAIKGALAFVPNSTPFAIGMDLIEIGFTPNAGYLPTSEDVRVDKFSELLLDIRENNPLLYNYVSEKFKKYKGYSIEDIDDQHPLVELFKEKKKGVDADEVLAEVLNENNSMLNQIISDRENEAQNRYLLDEQKRKQEQYRNIRNETMGGMAALQNTFILLGEPEIAGKISQASQLTDTLLEVGMSQMGPFATMNAYMVAANLAINLFSGSQKSESQVLMEQMQQLFQFMQEFANQVHKRFDRIDNTLAAMMSKINFSFAEVKQDLNQVKLRLKEVEKAIASIQEKMDADKIAEIERELLEVENSCFGVGVQAVVYMDDQKFLDTCFNKFFSYATEGSTFYRLNLDPIPPVELLALQKGIPFQRQLVDVAQYLSNFDGGNPVLSQDLRNELAHHIFWQENVLRAVNMVHSYPSYADQDLINSFETMKIYGEKRKEVQQGLLLDPDGSIRRATNFDLILSQYLEVMDVAISQIFASVDQYNEKKFDANMGLDQPKSFNRNIQQTTITFCEEDQFNPMLVAYVGNFYFYQMTKNPITEELDKVLYRVEQSGTKMFYETNRLMNRNPFPVHESLLNSLPNEVIWAETLDPGSIHICLEKYIISEIDETHPPELPKVGFGLDPIGPFVKTYDILYVEPQFRIQFRWNTVDDPQNDDPKYETLVISRPSLSHSYRFESDQGFSYTEILHLVWNSFEYQKKAERLRLPSFFEEVDFKAAVYSQKVAEGWARFEEVMRTRFIDGFDRKTIDGLTSDPIVNDLHKKVSGLTQLSQSALALGIDDNVPEKRDFEGVFSSENGLIGVNELVSLVFNNNMSKDQARARVNEGVELFRLALDRLENSQWPLTPQVKWIDLHLNEIDQAIDELRSRKEML